MHQITQIPGGVCAAKGFKAAGIRCGISKKTDKKDLALIFSRIPCSAAAVFTKNRVKAAPILVSQENIGNGVAQAIICNSGNANACTPDGMEVAASMCRLTAQTLNIPASNVLVASTGVIGQPLNIHPIEANIKNLVDSLSDRGSNDCLNAIMTTDTTEKEIAVSFKLGEKTCILGGITKGSGMIHPNMGTMLCFLTTDVAITERMLKKALELVVDDTFNMVSVDGDTSTNDMAAILANGGANNRRIDSEDDDFNTFTIALMYVCIYLARAIAADGEGASKLLECAVTGAPDDKAARAMAKSVISSSLFKAAMFGSDANWGRALCAMGYAGVEFDVKKVKVTLSSKAGSVMVCENGTAVSFSEEKAKDILRQNEIDIRIELDQGPGEAVAWGCDLTYDYVKINGDYRS